jgi:hypothetical protein
MTTVQIFHRMSEYACQRPALYCRHIENATEFLILVVSTSALFSGIPGFKSGPRDRLSWLRLLVVFFSQFVQARAQIADAPAIRPRCFHIFPNLSYFIFFHVATAASGTGPPHYWGFTITLLHTTLGRIPLDEWSVRRRDLVPVNTQHSDIHTSSGIWTRNSSKRAAVDPLLRPRGHWDRFPIYHSLITIVSDAAEILKAPRMKPQINKEAGK